MVLYLIDIILYIGDKKNVVRITNNLIIYIVIVNVFAGKLPAA